MRQPARTPPPLNLPSGRGSPEVLNEFDAIVFKRERLAPILRELLPLIERDWRENGVNQDRVPLKLNIDQYLDYDLLGILQVITARDDGLLVGFMFAFVHPHIMHSETGWALINLYWLYPEYRGQGIGTAMLLALEKFLIDAKITVVEASEKLGHAHGLFQRNGYKPTDTVLRKILEG